MRVHTTSKVYFENSNTKEIPSRLDSINTSLYNVQAELKISSFNDSQYEGNLFYQPLEIEVYKIPFEDKMLIRQESIRLPVTRSECKNHFCVEFEDLEIPLSGESLEELGDVLEFMLQIAWKRYVMGDEKKMTQGALKKRKKIMEVYKCI